MTRSLFVMIASHPQATLLSIGPPNVKYVTEPSDSFIGHKPPASALLARIPLGLHPSLHRLRGR